MRIFMDGKGVENHQTQHPIIPIVKKNICVHDSHLMLNLDQ